MSLLNHGGEYFLGLLSQVFMYLLIRSHKAEVKLFTL